MTKSFLLISAAASALASPALAQTTPEQSATPQSAVETPVPTGAPQDAPAVDAAQQGVLIFEPAFFEASRPNTALDMIARLPGFAFNPGNTDQRGFAGAAGNVLIDGDRPSTKSDSLENVLRRISAAGVERVELIRGGAPGIDMQGQVVVANIVLKRTVTTERVLEANAYVYPDGYVGPIISGSYSRRDGDNQLEASGRITTDRTDGTSDGFRRRYDAAGNLIQDADLILWDRFREVSGTAAWQGRAFGGKLRINGLAGLHARENAQDLLIRSGAGVDSFNDSQDDSLNTELGLNWTRDFSPRLGIEVVGLQRYSTEDYEGLSTSGGNNSLYAVDASSGESIGRAVIRYRPSDQWSVEAGGEAAYNFLDTANSYEENGIPVPLPSAVVKVEELRGEGFGRFTWRPNPTFTLEAGIRVEVSEIKQTGDANQSKSFVYPKPRVQATWTPRPGHQFRARIEREVGQLDFGDFAASADINIGQVEGGNPDLEPMKGWTFEAVYERRFWGQGVFDITYQHAELEDVIDVIPLVGGFDAVGNVGNGKQDYLQLRTTLPLDRLGLTNARLIARGSWSHSEVVDPVTGEIRRFQGNQNFGCGVDFIHDLNGGRWSYGLQHGCNVDRGDIFRVREVRHQIAEPFVTLWAQWKPAPNLTIRTDIGNATDRENGYDRDVYAGPRDIAPLNYRESRRTKMSPWLYVQVRRTF